jgi:hypothetical protein
MQSEKIIKSKERVKKHGEVFTASWVVEMMLDTEGIKESCSTINTKVLEPSAGLKSSSKAKKIININLIQGNFIKKINSNGDSLVFKDYRFKGSLVLYCDYTLDDIVCGVKKDSWSRL